MKKIDIKQIYLAPEDFSGKEVVVAGWVQKRRNLGSLIFVDLRDRTGIVQVVFDETCAKEVFDKAEQIEKGWGDKPCSHTNIEKEYGPFGHTGDYRCTQCGKTFTEDEVALIKSEKISEYQ